MVKKSIEKLLAAGYILLRSSEDGGSSANKPKIKYRDSYGFWRTLQIFDTKAARDRKIHELLDDENSKYLFL